MEPNGGYDETARNQRIKQLAREQHQSDGECEIDDNALISEGDDNGTYVQAWVWVDFSGTDLDKEKDSAEEPSECNCGADQVADQASHFAWCASLQEQEQ